nr:PREDICTED: uncharacterized protein LOC104150880 [Struthio camelus australis]
MGAWEEPDLGWERQLKRIAGETSGINLWMDAWTERLDRECGARPGRAAVQGLCRGWCWAPTCSHPPGANIHGEATAVLRPLGCRSVPRYSAGEHPGSPPLHPQSQLPREHPKNQKVPGEHESGGARKSKKGGKERHRRSQQCLEREARSYIKNLKKKEKRKERAKETREWKNAWNTLRASEESGAQPSVLREQEEKKSCFFRSKLSACFRLLSSPWPPCWNGALSAQLCLPPPSPHVGCGMLQVSGDRDGRTSGGSNRQWGHDYPCLGIQGGGWHPTSWFSGVDERRGNAPLARLNGPLLASCTEDCCISFYYYYFFCLSQCFIPN